MPTVAIISFYTKQNLNINRNERDPSKADLLFKYKKIYLAGLLKGKFT